MTTYLIERVFIDQRQHLLNNDDQMVRASNLHTAYSRAAKKVHKICKGRRVEQFSISLRKMKSIQ